MADLQKAVWVRQAVEKMVSLRAGGRTWAARVISFKGIINGLSAAQKTKLREAVDATGSSGADLLTELNNLETLANTIMTDVVDTKNLL